jgi:two-component system, OmpR family, phosphate regulon response regulator PhoB
MRKKILVVDDDADILELLGFTLKKAGFAIGTARDGMEALKKACTLLPDLILLDVMMPEMDGLAVCEILRRDPATSSIPILILTAASGQLSRLAGLHAGATEYMTKPFSPKEVVVKIEELLQIHGAPLPRTETHKIRPDLQE